MLEQGEHFVNTRMFQMDRDLDKYAFSYLTQFNKDFRVTCLVIIQPKSLNNLAVTSSSPQGPEIHAGYRARCPIPRDPGRNGSDD